MQFVLIRRCIMVETDVDVPEIYIIADKNAKWVDGQVIAIKQAMNILRRNISSIGGEGNIPRRIYIGDVDDTNVNKDMKYIYIRYVSGESDNPELLAGEIARLVKRFQITD